MVGIIFVLTGCASPSPLTERLDSPQVVSDLPTVDLSTATETQVSEESIRFVGVDSAETHYFAARNSDETPCIIIESNDGWALSCGEPGNLTIQFDDTTVTWIDPKFSDLEDVNESAEDIDGLIRVIR